MTIYAFLKLVLLDFGASREYAKAFVDNYIRVLEGAASGDRQQVLSYLQHLRFLSGYESKVYNLLKPTLDIGGGFYFLLANVYCSEYGGGERGGGNDSRRSVPLRRTFRFWTARHDSKNSKVNRLKYVKYGDVNLFDGEIFPG